LTTRANLEGETIENRREAACGAVHARRIAGATSEVAAAKKLARELGATCK